MLEKQAIIDEVFEETHELIDERTDMKIETINEHNRIPNNCPKCNHELDQIYCRSEKTEDPVFDLLVLKCTDCNAAYAFWTDTSGIEYWGAHLEPDPENTGNQPLDSKRRPVIPKKCAKEYTKAVSTHEAKNKELDLLIKEKLPQLYKAGLSLATINFAKNRVPSHLKGKKLTRKSAAKLLAGAIYATANSTTTEGSSLWKHKGEGITEEKLAEIFQVTRKTIRRWKRHFEEPFFVQVKDK